MNASPAAPLALGALCLAIGGWIMAVGAGLFPGLAANANAPLWLILCTGAIFALAGIAVSGRNYLPAPLGGLLGCLIISLMAIIPAWIAFGDGPRTFSTSITAGGLGLWWEDASGGRLAFAFGAVLTGLLAVFAWVRWWRTLTLVHGLLAALAGAAVSYALLVWMPAEPDWAKGLDDDQRIARYAALAEEPGRALAKGRGPAHWYTLPWRDVESWTADARSRLAARRQAPDGVTVLTVPQLAEAPRIDGHVVAGEWAGSLQLALTEPGSVVFLARHGGRLYLAARAPADRTPAGFDQFRFWFHLGLSPAFANERAFVDGSGAVNVLRSTRYHFGEREFTRTTWYVHRLSRAASMVDGGRNYELSLDLAEAGLSPGVPFPVMLEIEGDPVRDEQGRFRARTLHGTLGSHDQPLWLRIEALPPQ